MAPSAPTASAARLALAARTACVSRAARPLLAFALLLCAAPRPQAAAQAIDYYLPAAERFDPAIPTPEAFLGYAIGTHHTRHDRIVAYMQELARLSDRATYQEIGRTPGHRVMPVLTVTSPANHARLEQIRQQHLASLRPGAPPVPAADRKVIVHLGYGVHGNEPSSSEAALLTAYWLVAGTTPEVEGYLRDGVYHIEPVLNPDGRDRHSHWANMHKAAVLATDPVDREHNEAWPGGRTNHYWFDLNRDWLPLEHAESRARIDWHHGWMPHVVTDYHEMGTGSTYFFEPTKPNATWNPLLPERLYTEITLDFARHWAQSLDEIGSLYFTKETFDNSYPGYGSSYPGFLGALAVLFEQASSRGHAQENVRHGVLTFPFTIRNQVRTSLATVRAAHEHRAKLAEYQRDFYASALREADRFPVTAYVFGDARDAGRNRAFIELLLRHRIDVYELAEAVRVGDRSFQPGSAWVVPTAQPNYRLVRSIFERTSEYADSSFYDASTWTISLAYGIPDGELRSARVPRGGRVVAPPAPVAAAVPHAAYAYLLDWSDYQAPRALYHLLANGVYAEAAFQPFAVMTSAGERSYPGGSISVPLQRQALDAARVHELVVEAGELAGVAFQAAATGYATTGIDMGSSNFRPLSTPRALMLIGDGINSAEAGQIWHMLDTKYAIPITKADRRELGRIDFSRYDVIVLPSGSYGFMDGDRLEDLRRWVRGGGTLIALRQAAPWAVSNRFAPNTELAARDTPAAGTPGRRDYADAGAIRGAQAIGGSIWRADLDITHPLGFGYHDRSIAVWRDHSMFFAPSRNPYSTVVRLTDDPHLSGYISPRNLERLRGSPSLIVDQLGGGSVILMIDNPNFRGYWLGTNRLFLNALFFGRYITVPAAP
jgi:hypothetical protein